MKKLMLILVLGILLFSCQQSPEKPVDRTSADKNLNILLIMVDDMGWTDIGPYGGEISTPNLDKLAERGALFTDFHTSLSCSPTRSMLLSGTDNHLAGLGNMGELLAPNQVGQPGYEGHLNTNVVSLAEVLKDAGYHTYMAGKWRLGHDLDAIPGAFVSLAVCVFRSCGIIHRFFHHTFPDYQSLPSQPHRLSPLRIDISDRLNGCKSVT